MLTVAHNTIKLAFMLLSSACKVNEQNNGAKTPGCGSKSGSDFKYIKFVCVVLCFVYCGFHWQELKQ